MTRIGNDSLIVDDFEHNQQQDVSDKKDPNRQSKNGSAMSKKADFKVKEVKYEKQREIETTPQKNDLTT